MLDRLRSLVKGGKGEKMGSDIHQMSGGRKGLVFIILLART